MVQGYDSTFTSSVMLRNVFLVWTVYGAALIIFGVLALSADPLDGSAVRAGRSLDSIRAASIPLMLFTLLVCADWFVKSLANVKRLGRKPNIGVFARLKSHFLAFCFGVMALIFALIIPPLALVLVIVAVSLFFYSQMWLHLILLDVVKMLWGTSSPPNGQHEDVDHYVLLWFWSWVVFISLLATDTAEVDLGSDALSTLLVIAGGFCVVSALFASRLVMSISRRQDARLFAIIHEVDDEVDKPVTDQDIAAAWNRSATMLDLPR